MSDPKVPNADNEANGDGTQDDPRPTWPAFTWACVFLLVALVASLTLSLLNRPAFVPGQGFVLLAAFYVVAQVTERLLEFVSPLLSIWWPKPAVNGKGERTAAVRQRKDLKNAQMRVSRTIVMHGLAVVLGVTASAVFGLYFLKAVGATNVPLWADVFVTGLLVSGGTKPLHDFITLIQGKASSS